MDSWYQLYKSIVKTNENYMSSTSHQFFRVIHQLFINYPSTTHQLEINYILVANHMPLDHKCHSKRVLAASTPVFRMPVASIQLVLKSVSKHDACKQLHQTSACCKHTNYGSACFRHPECVLLGLNRQMAEAAPNTNAPPIFAGQPAWKLWGPCFWLLYKAQTWALQPW